MIKPLKTTPNRFVFILSPATIPIVRRSTKRLVNKYDRSISDAEQSIKLNPKNANAYDTLGFANTLKGEHAKAIEFYKLALDHSKNAQNDLQAVYYLHWSNSAYELKKYHEAIYCANKAFQLCPELSLALCWRGFSYIAINNLQNAIDDLQTVINIKSVDKGVNNIFRTGYQLDSLVSKFNQQLSLVK